MPTKSRTPKSAKTENQTVETVNETSALETTETLDEIKEGLEPGLHVVALDSIVKGENIRDLAKANKTDDIAGSIKTNGLQVPLTVDTNLLLLDGYRRYNVLKSLQKPNDDLMVQVLVMKIDLEDIPLFQFQTMQRSGISQDERSNAIIKYKINKAYLTEKAIAEKFGVDAKTVRKALSIYNASPSLNELVAKGKVTQNAAMQVIDSVANSDTISKLSASSAKKRLSARVNEITECIVDELEKEEDEKANNPEKQIKPFNMTKINKILVQREESPISVPKGEKEAKQIPVKKQAIEHLEKLMKGITFTSLDGDEKLVSISGTVSSEFILEITSFLEANHEESVNTWKDERDIEDELQYYEDNSAEGELFIQDSYGTYKTFNTEIANEFPSLKLSVENENSVEFIRVNRETLDRVVKKLNSKQINTLCVNQLKFVGKVNSKNDDSESFDDDPVLNETENLLKGIKQEEPMDENTDKLTDDLVADTAGLSDGAVHTSPANQVVAQTPVFENQPTGEMSQEEINARNDIFGIPSLSVTDTTPTQPPVLIPEPKTKAGLPDFTKLAESDRAIVNFSDDDEELNPDLPF